jgi:uncharacterized protein (TIGR03067 family)
MFSRSLMLSTMGLVGMGLVSPAAFCIDNQGELDGEWTAVRAERDAGAAADIVGHVLRFDGVRFSIQENGKTIYEGTFELDQSVNPCAINFAHKGGAATGKTWRGIYKTDGHTLTICDNGGDVHGNRPTSFATHANSGLVMVVFKRAAN